jgi:hypothetical protein
MEAMICFEPLSWLSTGDSERWMHEYVGNMHMHTTTSDGHGSQDEVADAAIKAGLDFIALTDHNVLPTELTGYYYRGHDRVLRLIGQEVHDLVRTPEKSHLLIYGTREDLSKFAEQPQVLIREVQKRGGISFLAHPVDCGVPKYDQPDLSWDDWEVEGYTGFEIWNFMTSFKCLIRSRLHAILYGLLPSRIHRGPEIGLMERWDRMLEAGAQVVAIGNADAHALPVRMGPFHRTIFPYEWLFRAVNTHVLLEKPLAGEVVEDEKRILRAIERGRCFVGYDRSAPSNEFMFSAHSEHGNVIMGERLRFDLGATLQVSTPHPAHIRMVLAGRVIREWPVAQHAVHSIDEPGAYRVEASLLRPGGAATPWIFSNPIYIERG